MQGPSNNRKGSVTVKASARSSYTSSHRGVATSHSIMSAMIEEAFEEAFKGELSDGDELATPTPRSDPVTTAIKESLILTSREKKTKTWGVVKQAEAKSVALMRMRETLAKDMRDAVGRTGYSEG